MRILIYSDVFGGNTTTFIYNEVVELSTTHIVRYLCIERKNPEQFPFDHVRVVPYQVNRITRKIRWILETRGIKLLFKSKKFSEAINNEIASFNPDIIHCHFGYEALRFIDNLDKRFRNIPTLISFRGYDASQHLNRPSYVRSLRKVLAMPNVHCTFVCDFLRKNLVNKGLVIKSYIILYSGTKLDHFTPSPSNVTENPEFIFLQISSFMPSKGHRYTILAFKRLLDSGQVKNARLILAGGGILLDSIKLFAQQVGMENYIEFPGWVDKYKTLDLLKKADVFVHHSVNENGATEGIPNALMEAMAMELPVISTLHAGIPELVEDGVNGYLVAERDIEGYAKAMYEIMKWPRRLPDNRKKVAMKFEFSKHMSHLSSFYDKIFGMKETSQ